MKKKFSVICLVLFLNTSLLLGQEVYKSKKVRTRKYNPQIEQWSKWSDWTLTFFSKQKIIIEIFEEALILDFGTEVEDKKNLFIKNIGYMKLERKFYGDIYDSNNEEIGYAYIDFSDNLEFYDLYKRNIEEDYNIILYLHNNNGINLGIELRLGT